VAAKPGGRKRGIAFAQRKHVYAAINQELDHFGVPSQTRYVQRSVAKIASFVDIDASVNQSLGSSEIAPSHNVKWSALSPPLWLHSRRKNQCRQSPLFRAIVQISLQVRRPCQFQGSCVLRSGLAAYGL